MEMIYRIELADTKKEPSIMSPDNNFYPLPTNIKVIGVGNGGCNAVNRMIEEGLQGVTFIAMNTDAQALSRSKAEIKLVLGERVTAGLGAGTDPEKGAEAAREDMVKIEELVQDADLVFIASGFGGGTGTGASPVIAEISKRSGALTIGVITKPFEMEGTLKMKRAEAGIEKIMSVIDSLIIIPNQNLFKMLDTDDTSFEEALSMVDDILRQGVQGISDIITQNGFGINVDFADVKTVISLSNGHAHLGIGVGKGEHRLTKAIENAFNNPLLNVASIKNSNGILANIVCPSDFSLKEYGEATAIINSYARVDANIKIGVCKDENIKDEIRITIVATGFDTALPLGQKNILEQESILLDNEPTAIEETASVKNNANIENNTSVENNTNSIEEIIDNTVDSANEVLKKMVLDEIVEEKKDHIVDDENDEDVFSHTKKTIEYLKAERLHKASEKIAPPVSLEGKLPETNTQEEQTYKNDEGSIDNNRETLSARSESKDFMDSDFFEKMVDKESSLNSLSNVAEEVAQNKENQKLPFDLISDDDMKIHHSRGIKNSVFGEVNEDVDYDTPAFLRRTIQTRKSE